MVILYLPFNNFKMHKKIKKLNIRAGAINKLIATSQEEFFEAKNLSEGDDI
jgi:hypothetical protein